jgi:ABC-type transport system substrate-binding protein
MKRRDFLKSVSGIAAGAMVPAPAIWSAAKADARSETLLIVSEGGPNNLDIHGIGTNVPGYEVSWNCYDRLISHEMKSGPGVNEPLCVPVQQSLGQIGIRTTINKVPGANWRTELNKKEMPLYTNVFSGWLDYPEYFFHRCHHGNNSVFNTMSYRSPQMDKLIDGARVAASTGDMPTYDADVKGFRKLMRATPRLEVSLRDLLPRDRAASEARDSR